MNEQLKELFNLSRKERNGSILLALIILATTILNFALPGLLSSDRDRSYAVHEFYRNDAQDKTIEDKETESEKNILAELYTPKRTLFHFDPNTINSEQWQKLGLSEKQAAVISRYLSNGGKFRTKGDLSKMYVINQELFRELEPYILLPSQSDAERNPSSNSDDRWPKNTPDNLAERSAIQRIELNSADTTDLKRLKGIGSSLARRIVTYRDKLGGFNHVDQLLEVYYMKPELVDTLRPLLVVDSSLVQRLDVNQITSDVLAKHPYISYSQAKALIAYRDKHGPFKDKSDLLRCVLMDEATVNKIAPYLTY